MTEWYWHKTSSLKYVEIESQELPGMESIERDVAWVYDPKKQIVYYSIDGYHQDIFIAIGEENGYDFWDAPDLGLAAGRLYKSGRSVAEGDAPIREINSYLENLL